MYRLPKEVAAAEQRSCMMLSENTAHDDNITAEEAQACDPQQRERAARTKFKLMR